jgi:hypothetical protein
MGAHIALQHGGVSDISIATASRKTVMHARLAACMACLSHHWCRRIASPGMTHLQHP